VQAGHLFGDFLLAEVGGLKQGLRASEALVANRNNLSIWKLERLILL
jgi:hypothetical protein